MGHILHHLIKGGYILNYYLLKPEVAGELGDNSKIVYEGGRIKEVISLEFVFLGWLGDEILKARPCYIVVKNIMDDFINNGIKGIKYEEIQVSFSEDFLEMCEDISTMPLFVRIIPLNRVDDLEEEMKEDVYVDKCNRLIVSERALEILKKYKIDNCDVEQL